MNDKFKNVSDDPETRIILQKLATIDEYEVLYQAWCWQGITAESIIFASSDISDLTDDQIEEMIRALPLVEKDSKITLKRASSGYTFVNFNFKSDE